LVWTKGTCRHIGQFPAEHRVRQVADSFGGVCRFFARAVATGDSFGLGGVSPGSLDDDFYYDE
jgi:hypothetical protein